jgi:ketosteroid isomerase-like protein
MSQETVETVIRSFYDAFNRQDFAVAKPMVHEDVVVEETPGFNPQAGIYRGRDEFRRYFDGWFKFWKSVKAEVLRIVPGSEGRVAILVRVTVVGRGSDVEVTDDWGHVVEIRDGKLVRATFYRTPEEALEAAGLSD